MNDREKLLDKLAAVDFSLIDLMLYLDTHPDDAEALRLKRQYARTADELRCRYRDKYGPLTAAESGGEREWEWIADPWPWNACV